MKLKTPPRKRTNPDMKYDDNEKLAVMAQQGDRDAMDQLVRKNIALVKHIAQRYHTTGLEHDDIVQSGVIGIIVAARRFDETKGVRFATYATWWIRQHIQVAIKTTSQTIRTPCNIVERIWALYHKEEDENTLTGDEIAESLGISKTEGGHVASGIRTRHCGSLNHIPDGFSEERTALLSGNGRGAEPLIQPDDVAGQAHYRARVKALLDGLRWLDPRDRTILEHRYGLFGQRPKTLREIGVLLGMSRERVRQIEKRAHRRLVKFTRKHTPDLS